MEPETRYARSGDINIAYQVIGTGPPDLVLVPGWLSNVEVFWEDPTVTRFLSALLLSTLFLSTLFLSRQTVSRYRLLSTPKATPAVLSEPRASPRGRNSERNLGEKFHTGCVGQATLTRSPTTGNVRYPGFLAEDLVLAFLKQTLSDFGRDFTIPLGAIYARR